MDRLMWILVGVMNSFDQYVFVILYVYIKKRRVIPVNSNFIIVNKLDRK